MKPKYYAVRRGKTTGVFVSWDECRAAVHGVAGAEFKSFHTRAEAEAFVSGDAEASFSGEKAECDALVFAIPDGLSAFVDGSYDVKTERYAYGCVIIAPDGSVTEKNGVGEEPEAKSARNVAGELMGTMTAMAYAAKNGYKRLRIYHDYSGICRWYKKEWKAESFVAKEYVAFSDRLRGGLKTEFVKVEAHTGVFFNERADALAKAALGIE